MNGTPSNGGRYTAVTCAGRRYMAHALVALAFHGERPAGLEVGHRNGDGTDNRPGNLVYVDHAANEQMKSAHGTSSAGTRNGNAKLTEALVAQIREAPDRRGIGRKLAEEHGVSQATVSMIRAGKRWPASGERIER
jgi:hypothetical protein